MFYIAILLCVLLSILDFFEFDWVMRFAKVNFKHFPLKAQRIVFACLGSIAIVPIVILRVVIPTIEEICYFYAVIANLVVLTVYILIMRGVSQQSLKREKIREKILELHLHNSDDINLIKKELKSWYDISASTKEIENIINQIRDNN